VLVESLGVIHIATKLADRLHYVGAVGAGFPIAWREI
jgi:hypothetical protein